MMTDKHKQTVIYCIIITALIIAGLWMPSLLIVAFLFHAITVIQLPVANSLQMMFFILPYALIYKFPGVTTSFFSIIQLLIIGIHYVRKPKINSKIFPILLIVVAYFMARMNSYYMAIPKLLSMLLFVLVFIDNYNKKDIKKYANYLIFGVLSSCILGMFKENIPQLLAYYEDLNYGYINGVEKLRFSALFDDPNYFSMALVCCLVLLIVLRHLKQYPPILFWVSFATLSVFGLLTYSKSFLLIYAAVIIYSILLNVKQRKIGMTIFQIVLVIGALNIILDGRIEIFNDIFSRFSDTQGFTTGRDVIWDDYWAVINESKMNQIWGLGLDAPYIFDKAAHSMYVELIYYAGFVGLLTFMLLWVIILFSKHSSRIRLYNLFLPVAIFIMYGFLSGFLNYAFPFYMILSWIVIDNQLKRGQETEELQAL